MKVDEARFTVQTDVNSAKPQKIMLNKIMPHSTEDARTYLTVVEAIALAKELLNAAKTVNDVHQEALNKLKSLLGI